MNPVTRISPVTDDEAARMVRPATLADLAEQITASPPAAAPGRLTAASRRGRWAKKGRWLVGIPVAAALAVALLVVTSLARPGQRVGPVTVGPPAAQALSFSRQGGALIVIVRNPLADPARYRAEFARHHLRITLKLLPASPSLVGTVVYLSGDVTPITAQGKCHLASGGAACPVGVRVPANFHGQAQVVFGRAARPGEQYASAASAFAPGEVMHGMRVTGHTVAQVLAVLRHRGVSVPLFNYAHRGYARNLRSVPGTWFVYDAVPWAPQQVLLFVGPTRTQPNPGPPQPAGGKPAPSPSPTRAGATRSAPGTGAG
jgi:hypothetical protein